MTIIDFIKRFSARTWSDIRFARNKVGVVRLGEVTLTQNLVLSIAYQYYNSPSNILLFEAQDEKTHGNDIELFISTSNGKLIAFPCQAKIVDKDDREAYSKISHSNKSSGLQIDALLNYAADIKGIPLYLLYNYSKEHYPNVPSRVFIERKEYFGCSYVPATHLKHYRCPSGVWRKPLPTFSDLHPSVGKPFYQLFAHCNQPKQGIVSAFANDDPGKLITWNVQEYSLRELQADSKWRAIDYDEEGADIGRVLDQQSFATKRLAIFDSETGNDAASVYSPKYRLIISNTLI